MNIERIEEEILRLDTAIGLVEIKDSKWEQMYAARQALRWALEPEGFAPHRC